MFDKSYEEVYKFNAVAGNLNTPATYEQLKDQLALVQEELTETLDKGILSENNTEIADGACDMLVTLFGFVQMLERSGYDIVGAMEAVCANNNTKFIPDGGEGATRIINNSIRAYDKKGERVSYHYNKEYGVFVLKDGNGKVRKPIGFESVNVEAFIPKENLNVD